METNNTFYPNSKPVIMEVLGNPIGWFDCITDVARKFGHTTSTITKRIERKAVINGVLIRFPNEGENIESLPYLSPPKKYGKLGKIKSKRITKKEKEISYKNDDVELDREKYNIVKYEVRNLRVCITRCAYRDYPQPLVGSAACVQCHYFRGRNKKDHEVACSNSGKYIV